MTAFKNGYLLPVLPKDQKPIFPEFHIDEEKVKFLFS